MLRNTKVPKYTLRQQAIDDLDEIWDYTFYKWSASQADSYLRTIRSALKDLSEQPTTGKAYDNIGRNILGFRVSKHVVFYHVISDNEIEVIRILHGKMDFRRRLG